VIVLLVVGNLRALQILAIDEGLGAGEPTPVAEDVRLAQLGIDVVALTGFFVLAAGPENPFTILYVIHVAMAAIMLPPRRSATRPGAASSAVASGGVGVRRSGGGRMVAASACSPATQPTGSRSRCRGSRSSRGSATSWGTAGRPRKTSRASIASPCT